MNLIREINEGITINNKEDSLKYIEEFKNQDREHFIVLGLDTRNKVIYREIVSIGGLNYCSIHPREVFKKAILCSANSIIIAHNHPSGDLNPSKEDKLITKNIKKAGELLNIKLIDSLIIGNNKEDVKSIIQED